LLFKIKRQHGHYISDTQSHSGYPVHAQVAVQNRLKAPWNHLIAVGCDTRMSELKWVWQGGAIMVTMALE